MKKLVTLLLLISMMPEAISHFQATHDQFSFSIEFNECNDAEKKEKKEEKLPHPIKPVYQPIINPAWLLAGMYRLFPNPLIDMLTPPPDSLSYC